MAKATFKAFCLVCCGGGKVLMEGGIRACEREAVSHGDTYQHDVTILRPKARRGEEITQVKGDKS